MFNRFKRTIQPLLNVYHHIMALVASLYYGMPSRHLKVIGVTGTDGKTTTSHLIYHILTTCGKKASIISSIYAKIGPKEYETGLHVTTPDASLVQKLLKRAVEAGSEYFVLETTSHALDQGRVYGIHFAIGVVTNITPEHLDYHKTYDQYVMAKMKLLTASDTAIINRDDRSYDFLKQRGKRLVTYGLKHTADFSYDARAHIDSSITTYNNYNYLAAIAVARSLGLPEKAILSALKTFTLPKGRLETVYDKDFKVIIDFAHTPNSINNLLESLRSTIAPGGRLIHVFGAAGLRDAKKRHAMGEASATYADNIILTEEDYRTEDPEKICEEIGKGIKKKGKEYTVIIDRKKAIEEAIRRARKADTVVLTGKSHEQSLARGTKEYPWSEDEAVSDALKRPQK